MRTTGFSTTGTALLIRHYGNTCSARDFCRVSVNSGCSDKRFMSNSDVDVDASEFELLQEALYQQEMNKLRESTWMASVKSLPFECTECGKCCKTEGNVYLSPEELKDASAYKNMTTSEFIEEYAGNTMDDISSKDDKVDNNLPWVLVKNTETEHGPACIFLDPKTNHCRIYPVRPIQCSTYPFWPNVLQSEGHWNDEVRCKDTDSMSTLPAWTSKGGGCEGMQLVNDDNVNAEDGISIDDALHQLSLYKRTDRRLPRNGRSNDGCD
ncbi:MAG: hypothetical protein SGARI_001703 [Bacillariaceae sp.]